jgi:hypothetical protein
MKKNMIRIYLLAALIPFQGRRPMPLPGDTPADRATYLKSILMPTGLTSETVVWPLCNLLEIVPL